MLTLGTDGPDLLSSAVRLNVDDRAINRKNNEKRSNGKRRGVSYLPLYATDGTTHRGSRTSCPAPNPQWPPAAAVQRRPAPDSAPMPAPLRHSPCLRCSSGCRGRLPP